MRFVVEADVTIFCFEYDGVGGKCGAAGKDDEHGGKNKVFHGVFSCLLMNVWTENPPLKKI
jgi:hypothetical protein